MGKLSGKISKAVAGCISVIMALCIGADACFAADMSGTDEKLSADSGISPVTINETNFPDPVFREVISGKEYNPDGNNVLSAKEISQVINIYCEGMGVKSVKGVEFFVNLQGLWCKDNKIKSLDVTNNKDLRGLWCSGNPLTSLNLTKNPELLWVYCYDCKLTSLNLSKNPKMAFVEINSNPLTGLNVRSNHELEHLTCGDCGLKKLDLSQNPKLAHLDAFSNKFTSLDVSNCEKLKRLDIWNNNDLGNVDVSHNPGLQYYNCAYNGVTSIDVSNNKELNKLICSYNQIKELNVTDNPKLVYLDCAQNEIKNLDLSKNPKLYFLQAFTNPFTELDIGYNPFLIKTYKEGEKKYEYEVCKGHSWTIDYGGDTSTGGDNIYFICFDDGVKLLIDPKYEAPQKNEAIIPNDVPRTDLITRERAVQTLYEMAGKPKPEKTKSRFTDVESGAWYEDALLWGEENSICVGTPDVSSDTFGVGDLVTRQDLALMMMRYSEYMNYKRAIDFGRADDFIDYYEIDYYAWEAITWAATWNIMIGKGDPDAPKEERTIEPHTAATRDDYLTMIERMLEVNDIVDQELPVIPVDPVLERKKGDVVMNDKIDNADLLAVKSHIKKIKTLTGDDLWAADVDGNGAVNNTDLIVMKAHIKGVKKLW